MDRSMLHALRFASHLTLTRNTSTLQPTPPLLSFRISCEPALMAQMTTASPNRPSRYVSPRHPTPPGQSLPQPDTPLRAQNS
ncbi:hypothetical protein M427DRAFT_63755 [Gonapodya prolifera JEL478]|uniref:Uncharacterized protein n=1 Tax=Gonapodya prolifera (strain JEL478) TaxID=1344416 RepID=A0A138ZYU5_GONPJ|nr:hypothetical protein M427DRAFT_63755 [Gonapodya prolifera JEL478]|eukprot:KXS09682.1 hypothetical protein M427DRAFT_63755 [Gonapodya prolifera JEL478]